MRQLLSVLLMLLFVSGASADDFYLDADATGNDSGTSLANAWVDLIQVKAAMTSNIFDYGDTLYISGGATSKTYPVTVPFIPDAGSNFRVLDQAGHNGIVIFDGGDTVEPLFELRSNANLYIDGYIGGNRHIRFQNWGGAGAGNSSEAMSTNDIVGLTVRYVEFINDDYTCSLADCTDVELKGCVRSAATLDTLFEYNYFEGCVRETLPIGNPRVDGLETYDSTIIQYNEMKGFKDQYNRGGPDGPKGLGNTTVRYNLIYHVESENAEYNANHVAEDGIQIIGAPSASPLAGGYTKVYGNVVHGYSSAACRMDSANDHVYIYNNLFYVDKLYEKPPEENYVLHRGIEADVDTYMNELYIYNNTIVGFNQTGIRLAIRANVTSVTGEIKNNILWDSYLIEDISGGTGVNIVWDNNLVMDDAGGPGVIDGITQANDPYDAGKTFDFVSYTLGAPNNDFHLSGETNMAIGSGVNLISVFTDDIEGSPRDVSAPWDLGAYVWDSEYTPPTEYETMIYSDGASIITGD